MNPWRRTGFNPSVGILGVQARQRALGWCRISRFQSLGRDSGCSSLWTLPSVLEYTFVSIPRSGFWVFKLSHPLAFLGVSVSFNPSVGILGVQARLPYYLHVIVISFQSLGRDSGCSSQHTDGSGGQHHQVSIPRSGFWVFKRASDRNCSL